MLTTENIPLQSFRLETLDIEEMSAAFDEWEMHVIQNEKGSFNGELYLSKNAEGEIYFYSARINKRCFAKGNHMKNLILFTMVFPGSGSIFNGEDATGLRLFCNTQERGLTTDAGPGFVSFSVGIETSLLLKWLEEEKLTPPHDWNFHIDYSTARNRKYIENYCLLIYNGLLQGSISVPQLKHMVVSLLDHKSCSSIIRSSPNFNTIRLVTEFVIDQVNNSEKVCLEDMIEQTKGSQRTFFYNFKKYTGLSPMRFVKNTNLVEVHNRLKKADPLCSDVADIATDHGFTHMGQFASDFKRLFGTSPSAILGKKRYMS